MQVFQNRFFYCNVYGLIVTNNLEVAIQVVTYEGRIWQTKNLYRSRDCVFLKITVILENVKICMSLLSDF